MTQGFCFCLEYVDCRLPVFDVGSQCWQRVRGIVGSGGCGLMAKPQEELAARPLLPLLLLLVWSIVGPACFGLELAGVSAGILVGVLFYGFWLCRLQQRPARLPLLCFLLVALLLGGSSARRIAQRRSAAGGLIRALGGRPLMVELRARVAAFPRPARRGWSLQLEPLRVQPALPLGPDNAIRLYLPPISYADSRLPRIGDLISVKFRLSPLRPARHPFLRGGMRHLLLAGYVATGRLRDLSALRLAARPPTLWGRLEGWRRGIYRAIFTVLGPQHQDGAAILAAVLLGCRDRLRPAVRELFLDFGVFHLFAVSGLHLGVVAGLIFWFGRFLTPLFITRRLACGSLRPAVLLSLGFLPFYIFLAGFQLPVVRAGIMAAGFLLALLLGRSRELWSSLLLAALVILLLWPEALFGLSFQLSFCAVAVIVWLLPRLDGWWRRVAARLPSTAPRLFLNLGRAFFSYLLVSLAITLAGAPILLARVHFLSLASLPANLLLVPLFSLLIIPLGLVSLPFFGLPKLFHLLLLPQALLLEEGLKLAAGVKNLLPPLRWYGPIPTGMESWLLGAVLVTFAFVLTWPEHRRRGGAILLLLLFGLAGGTGLRYWRQQRPELHLAAFVGGRPAALLLEVPGGEAILFNGGCWAGARSGELEKFSIGGRFSPARQIIAPYCWRRHIHRIPILVLTEPQRGRLGGLLFLVEHFGVEEIWYHGVWSGFPPFRDFNRLTRDRFGVRWRKLTSLSASWVLNGVAITAVGPPANDLPVGGRRSAVLPNLAPSLLFTFQDRRLLFWGGGRLDSAMLPQRVDLLVELAPPGSRPPASLSHLQIAPGGARLVCYRPPAAARLPAPTARAAIPDYQVARDGFIFLTLPRRGPICDKLPVELISGCQTPLE